MASINRGATLLLTAEDAASISALLVDPRLLASLSPRGSQIASMIKLLAHVTLEAPGSSVLTAGGHNKPDCGDVTVDYVGAEISLPEAAALLGVEPRTLRRAAGRGDLPGRRIPAGWFFRRDVVDGYGRMLNGDDDGA